MGLLFCQHCASISLVMSVSRHVLSYNRERERRVRGERQKERGRGERWEEERRGRESRFLLLFFPVNNYVNQFQVRCTCDMIACLFLSLSVSAGSWQHVTSRLCAAYVKARGTCRALDES